MTSAAPYPPVATRRAVLEISEARTPG